MSLDPRARTHDRLAELVTALSGALTPVEKTEPATINLRTAREAVDLAAERNGDDADQLLNVAEALLSLRSGG